MKTRIDLVPQRLADGCWIRVMMVVDQYIREFLTVRAYTTPSVNKIAMILDKIIGAAA